MISIKGNMGKWQYYWRNKGHQTKCRVEHCKSIDASQCYDKRKLPFEEGEDVWFHGCRLNLFQSYALTTFFSGGKEYDYQIPMVATKCNYGGHRHWFLCPMPSCMRRSKKLYLSSGGHFLCRKCLNLAYITQSRSEADRIIDKKWHLIEKYGGERVWSMQKPKGMHQKTFDRIVDEIWRLDRLAMEKIAEMFGKTILELRSNYA
jgi:hypothetical protein